MTLNQETTNNAEIPPEARFSPEKFWGGVFLEAVAFASGYIAVWEWLR